MPKKMTIREQLIRGLERLGFQRAPIGRSMPAKFEVFTASGLKKLYVGRAGALRRGTTLATSRPVDGLKAQALAAGLPEAHSPGVDLRK